MHPLASATTESFTADSAAATAWVCVHWKADCAKATKRTVLLVSDGHQNMCSSGFMEYLFPPKSLCTWKHSCIVYPNVHLKLVSVIHIPQLVKQMHQGLAFCREVFQNFPTWPAFVLLN